jgi:hypothetical protein
MDSSEPFEDLGSRSKQKVIGVGQQLTVACVPTGMKTGVDIAPCGV